MHLLAEQKEGASGSNTPTESCFSLGTNSEFTDFSASSSNLRVLLPEKLQIVKPIEGKRMIFLLLTAEKDFTLICQLNYCWCVYRQVQYVIRGRSSICWLCTSQLTRVSLCTCLSYKGAKCQAFSCAWHCHPTTLFINVSTSWLKLL